MLSEIKIKKALEDVDSNAILNEKGMIMFQDDRKGAEYLGMHNALKFVLQI